MSETSHERWSEELSAYLLGALKPPEAEALEHHLKGCDRCREEVRWLMPALDALPETVERLEPRPRLRERLMAEVREEAGVQPEPSPAPRPGLLERIHDAFTGPHWRPFVAGVAAVLIAVAVVGYEIGSDGSAGDGGSRTTLEKRQASGIFAAVSMEGTGHGRIELTDVPDLPADKVLEAWVERNGAVEAVPTLFVPNGEGRAATTIGDMSGVSAVMVTQEPPGGSKAPTSKPIVELAIPPA
jgi:anti-sigma factor RsiW